MELEVIFLEIVYLDLYSYKVWEFSIFSFCTPLGDIYGRLVLNASAISPGEVKISYFDLGQSS